MSLASAVGAILSEKNEGLLDRSLVMGTFSAWAGRTLKMQFDSQAH